MADTKKPFELLTDEEYERALELQMDIMSDDIKSYAKAELENMSTDDLRAMLDYQEDDDEQ